MNSIVKHHQLSSERVACSTTALNSHIVKMEAVVSCYNKILWLEVGLNQFCIGTYEILATPLLK